MKKLTKKQLELLVNTPDEDLLKVFKGFTRAELRRLKKQAKQKIPVIKDIVEEETKLAKKERQVKYTAKKYRFLLEKVEKLEKERDAILKLTHPIQITKIEPKKKTVNGDAVAIIVASDWHYEEEVKSETVNGLNEFNLDIAHQRVERFWQNSLKLIKEAENRNSINKVILALLGDFISGHIHDELMETNQLLPAEAIFKVQMEIISGIQFLLDNTNKKFLVHCVSGNHSRMTKRSRHATFNGNSLEDYMYHNIALYFKKEPRIKFNIPAGYLSYLKVFNLTLRFHHGHGIRYQGGVGGIYIPANKAIAQWNKGRRSDIDVFAHWHQLKDGGNFLINGSLIGYNAYAMSIKADFEEPRQLFFLINKYGRTGYTKIVV